MNTGPAGDLAGSQPRAESSTRNRGGSFPLPVSTSFRFTLLIAAVAATSFFIYEGIYLATPRGPALIRLIDSCQSKALAGHPTGAAALAIAYGQAAACYSGAERTEAAWGLLGVGVLVVVASAIFLAQPWWSRRRYQLTELAGADTADLVSRLEQARRRAGAGPVSWLLQPSDHRLSAFAFGRPGRRCVAVSGGAAVAAIRKPASFDAVIMHELAHIENRDIDQTYLALAVWRAFVVAGLLPLAVLLIVSRVLGEPQLLIWRIVLLALIVYSLRNAILRSREFDADARALQLDPAIALDEVLAGLPASEGRRAWQRVLHLGWTHPSGRERAAALADPAPLFRFGFWDGLAIGLVAALGASAVREIATRLTTHFGVRLIVPAVVIAAFAGPALAVAMWRRQSRETEAGVVRGWAAGAGLGLGLAVGPVIAPLAAYTQGLAPDHPSLAAFGVLAVWIVLVILVFAPFPAWLGHWADAWQQPPDRTAPRIAARGALVAAALAAWAVLAIGLYLLLENFTGVFGPSGAAADWQGLPAYLRLTGPDIAQTSWVWVPVVLVVGMPLAGAATWALAGQRLRPHRWLAPVLLGVAGCLTTVALMVALSALTHARIAEGVRWDFGFNLRFDFFEEQAIVVIALICALVVAARARSAVGLALSVAVGAAVAAVGAFVQANAQSMGYCVSSLNLWYTNPPSGSCLTSPGAVELPTVTLGTALLSTLFAPAAYAAGVRLRRRIQLVRRPTRVSAIGWTAAAVIGLAAVTVTALWGPSASAQGVRPTGDIGNDGWIAGYRYEIRIEPPWYLLPRTQPGVLLLVAPEQGVLELMAEAPVDAAEVAAYQSQQLRLGARLDPLDGAPGLLLAGPSLPRNGLEERVIAHDSVAYFVTLFGSPLNSPYLEGAYSYMLASWRWTG